MSVHGAYRRTDKVGSLHKVLVMAPIADCPPRSLQKHRLPKPWLELLLGPHNARKDTGKYLANPASRTRDCVSGRPMVVDH